MVEEGDTWTGAGQVLRWALWCSARTPLQDGEDDSLHCQFCHPTQDVSSLHLRRTTPAPGLPMDVNEKLGCNYINSSSSQLLVPSPVLSLKSTLNKLPMQRHQAWVCFRKSYCHSQHCLKAESLRISSGLPLQFEYPGQLPPLPRNFPQSYLHHATYYMYYLGSITENQVEKT